MIDFAMVHSQDSFKGYINSVNVKVGFLIFWPAVCDVYIAG